MKMFWIVFSDYYDEVVTDALQQSGYKTYLKLHGATGQREHSEARLGTRGAPGKINCIFMPLPDEEIPLLLDIVQRLKAEHPTSGIVGCTFQLEEFF